jgi:hypothetical protein
MLFSRQPTPQRLAGTVATQRVALEQADAQTLL